MEKAMIRMYFEGDKTFKTFLVLGSTTTADLMDQVQKKMNTTENFCLYWKTTSQGEHLLGPNEKPFPIHKQHGTNVTFTIRSASADGLASGLNSLNISGGAGSARRPPPTVPPPRPTPGGGRGAPPLPTTPPPAARRPVSGIPAGSAASFSSPPSTLAAPATEDEFDALLNQLQADIGGASSRHGGSGGGAGGLAYDPLKDLGLGFDLGVTTTNYPTCGACGEPVKSNLLNAFGMSWHKEHLACAVCHRNFLENDVPVVEGNDGQAYCQTDYLERFAPKCSACSSPIQGECTNALGKQWHPSCFVCHSCKEPFHGTFFENEGNPYCEKHYYEAMGLLCPECERPIIGKCVNAKGKRYHPQHFVCSHCKKKLTGNEYYYHDNKLYCKSCSIIFYG
ncbi:Transforming growth factor beta-1-induced transcript 1 protein [Balamuthia mandrillaris]